MNPSTCAGFLQSGSIEELTVLPENGYCILLFLCRYRIIFYVNIQTARFYHIIHTPVRDVISSSKNS